MRRYQYLAYGLHVRSEWAIPSLAVHERHSADHPDVEIVRGMVSIPNSVVDVDGMKIHAEGDRLSLEIEDCGRFSLIGGRKIVVEPESEATMEQVNLYLLGSVFGGLLHQRCLLPFHCNGVEIDGAAFLFCGDSGAGKSTLAAHFVDRGFRILSDDVCALHFDDDGRLWAAPGVSRLKLWDEALKALGRSSEGLALLPWYEDKFEIPLGGQDLDQSMPVGAIYHLRRADEGRPAGIHPLKGREAANAITANIYRRRIADLAGMAPFYMDATGRIAESVPIFTMNRKWGFDHFRDEAMAVEGHLRHLIPDATSGAEGRLSGGKCGGSARG